MKKFLLAFTYLFLKFMLWFRYRVKVEGLEKINAKALKKPGGVLFLPNHPCVFIDPVAVTLAVWKKFPIRPMMIEYMYYMPIINKLARLVDALPVPNFDTSANSLKRKKNEVIFQDVIDGISHKQNFLIYPSGRTKSTSLEIIAGASGVHRIIGASPEANVVLVRTKGLWGSSFSRAFTGMPPPLFSTIWEGIKHVLKNLLFFTPRRNVIISFELAPEDFPYKGSRAEMNKYLEAWYNRPDGLTEQRGNSPGDSLILIPNSMWSKKLPVPPAYKALPENFIPMSEIPAKVQDKVFAKLAEITKLNPKDIKPGMTLTVDLGLDSLDIAELIAYIADEFDVNGVLVPDLTTVNKLMGLAAGKIATKEKKIEFQKVSPKWLIKGSRERAFIQQSNTIPELFLNNCSRWGKRPVIGDDRAGVMTYSDLKLRALLLAEYIRHLPGEYIGILLPSAAATALLVYATQLAGKVPLMINWTVGTRHLETVVQTTNVKAVLTSWAFLDRLENVELTGIEDKLLMLEDIRRQFSLKDKLKAYRRSKQKTETIMKQFGLKNDPEGKAVLLFTSGSESMPKGVPLTHKNILSNLQAVLSDIEIFNDDILLAILPPFHSFGFTICSLLGILGGFRTAFYPNPTDGEGLAAAFERWQATVICGAPTFIKGMLKAAKKQQMATMRMCVTGAEKAPPDLFQLLEGGFGTANQLIEGYGITECSPGLAFNRPGKPHKGVGQPLSNVEMIIVHPETLELLPTGTQGLILTRGPNVFSGYINPGLISPFVTVSGKEWYKTGDLGFFDENNALTISGRLKRFVKIGGEMVSLESIETALLQIASKKQWPINKEEGPILAICAKETEGEKTRLFLFTRYVVTIDEINKALKECGFSNLIRVTSVFSLSEIPIMGTGKVNYRALQDQYLG